MILRIWALVGILGCFFVPSSSSFGGTLLCLSPRPHAASSSCCFCCHNIGSKDRHDTHHRMGVVMVLQCQYGGGGGDDGNDAEQQFLDSLRTRLLQVTQKERQLPLVVLDPMLPRQRLELQVENNPLLMELVRDRLEAEMPFFGMLGMERVVVATTSNRSTTTTHRLLQRGVEVEIARAEFITAENGGDQEHVAIQLQLVGTRRFEVVGELTTAGQGWTEAKVQWLDDSMNNNNNNNNDDDRLEAVTKARELTIPNLNLGHGKSLIQRWIELATERERFPGQIDELQQSLGNRPPPAEDPTELAFWVAALINPLPAMGVAMEIRPAMLNADTALERIQIAANGIVRSIQHMDGSAPLWK